MCRACPAGSRLSGRFLPYRSGIGIVLLRNEPLGRYTTFGLGGPAAVLAKPESEEQLVELLETHDSVRMLGGGSNVLIRDEGTGDAVARLSGQAFNFVRRNGSFLKAGAATPMAVLLREARKAGLSGLECMVGIPGVVGGSIARNSGAAGGSISDRLARVKILEADGVRWLDASCFDFGYRSASVRGDIVLAAEFELEGKSEDYVSGRMAELLSARKRTQPVGARCAGCVFKNPPGDSAGRLIDRAGLKGVRIGGASVSMKHANFIVAEKRCCTSHVLELIEMVRERVAERFGVRLEVEVEIW